jgi:hypothetical protein
VNIIDSNTGNVINESSVEFSFGWPSIQMTTDLILKKLFVCVFQDDNENPVVYKFNNDLSLNYTWSNNTFCFFDLQYSPLQRTIYGIKVTTKYGRVLSNFTFDETTNQISAIELYTLPYMWYVNASSYDAVTNTYFALINNFPGQSNSTLDQQIIVGDFSVKNKPNAILFPLNRFEYGILQFISYSQILSTLVFSSMTSPYETNNEILVGTFNIVTGVVDHFIFKTNGYAIGPLVIQETLNRILLFIKPTREGKWSLWSIPLVIYSKIDEPALVHTYDDYVFAAAVHSAL